MKKFKLSLVMTMVACLAAFGCGDDDSSSNNTNNSNNQNNVNNTNNANNTNNENNTNNQNNTNNENNTNNQNNTNNFTVPIFEPPPSCDDPNPPARCADNPADVEWAPSSVLATLVLEEDGECCFEYDENTPDGDQDPDSGLAGVIGILADLSEVNDTIAASIDSGDLIVVLEHQGLTALDADAQFTVNFYVGSLDAATTMLDPMGGNLVLINPASFDGDTAQAQAYLPDATLTGTDVAAGPGVFVLSLELFGTTLSLTITQTQIEASVDTENSSVENGVALVQGRLGGVVTLEDLGNAFNGAAAGCECFGIEGDLVNYDADAVELSCTGTPDEAACTEAGDDTCAELAGTLSMACGGLSFATGLTDVDTTGDRTPNAFSIGATFETYGAVINGVEPVD